MTPWTKHLTDGSITTNEQNSILLKEMNLSFRFEAAEKKTQSPMKKK